jgi:hypothetical protein
MRRILIPEDSRLFPSPEIVARNRQIILDNPPQKFASYWDWFHFIHIDPVQRWIHLIGMIIGSYFYVMIFIEWSLLSWLYYLLGVIFFYGAGLISHLLYDTGAAKSDPRYFHITLWAVIHINLRTLTFTYDSWLRDFLRKYPFSSEYFKLREKSLTEAYEQIRAKSK